MNENKESAGHKWQADQHKAAAQKHPVGSKQYHAAMAAHYSSMGEHHASNGHQALADNADDRADHHNSKAFDIKESRSLPKFKTFVTEAAKAHDPHAAFRKEANAHLESKSGGSKPHIMGYSDKVKKSFKGPHKEWVHGHSCDHNRAEDAQGRGEHVSSDQRQAMNEKKAVGLHTIAKKHGFVKGDKHAHHYVHPESGADLHIHHPNQKFYTDRHAGYDLRHPLKPKLAEEALDEANVYRGKGQNIWVALATRVM